MQIGRNFKAVTFQNGFVRIFIVACHIIVGMVACYHHGGHNGNVLNVFGLQQRDDGIKMRPSFYRINIGVVKAELKQAVLHNGVISVGGVRRAMCQKQYGATLRLRRELCRKCLHGVFNIVALAFLTHPVHQRRADGHFFKEGFVMVEHVSFVGVFNAGNNIQRAEHHARIAFAVQLFQRFLRRGVGNAFVLFNALDNNVRGKGKLRFYAGAGFLNFRKNGVDGFGARFFIGSAEAHHKDGVLIGQIGKLRVFIHANTNLCGV